MSFKFTVKQNPLEIEFEVGSIGEGTAILQDNETELARAFSTMANVNHAAVPAPVPQAATVQTVAAVPDSAAPVAAEGKRRGRPPKDAVAPPMLPVPDAPALASPPPLANAPPVAPPTGPIPPGGDGVPAFLARAPVAAAVTPAPPPPPAAALSFRLGNLVADELRRRGDSPAMLDWIYSTGVVSKGATFTESLAAIQFTLDEKVSGVAAALGIS